MTKNQRRDLYYAAMFEIVDGSLDIDAVGLCSVISNLEWELKLKTNVYDHMRRDYPELYAQKPKIMVGIYWFKPCPEMIPLRLECLSKAIDMCEKR